MFSISNNKITLTRGDTCRFTIGATDRKTKETWEPDEKDIIVFTVKRDTTTKEILLQKQGISVTIHSHDTESWDYGEYVFDVQVTLANGDVDTIIAPTDGEPNFFLTDEVTF